MINTAGRAMGPATPQNYMQMRMASPGGVQRRQAPTQEQHPQARQRRNDGSNDAHRRGRQPQQRQRGGQHGPVGNEKQPGNHLIVFDKVTKIYDDDPDSSDNTALQELSATIDAGEFVFLIGHSGSGKSTLMSMLTREIKPTTGRVIVSGQNLNDLKDWKVPYYRRNIGCVYQDFRLLDYKTAYENVAFALEVVGKRSEIDERVPTALALVGLEEKGNKRPNQLSGGEKQRVAIARAVINRPPILICDEPTGNLDPANALGIMALLEKLNQNGITVIMATHDMDIVRQLDHRIIELSDGKMLRDEGSYRG